MNYEFDHLLTNTIKSVLIYKDECDNYQLYGEYSILKQGLEFLVTRKGDGHKVTFHNIKPAVAWCIMDKRLKFYEANRIKELDINIVGLSVDLQNQERFLKNKNDIDKWTIHSIKLTDIILRRNLAISEMNKYIDLSNTWQVKKFKMSSPAA